MQKLFIGFEKHFTIESSAYDTLYKYKTQRPVNAGHVLVMKDSVIRNGQIRPVMVVEIKDKLFVIDGQHLLEALIQLDMPVWCQMIECDSDEQITQLIIDLNNTSKSWQLTDYVNSWAMSGLKDYRQLKRDSEITFKDVQITVIMQAYTQKSRAKSTKLVKEGKFEIVNKTRGEELIQNICELNYVVPNTRQMNEALIKLMLNSESYNQQHMYKRLKAVGKTYVFSTKEGQLYKQLLEIYNS